MALGGGGGGQALHPFGDFDHALLAFALFVAGRGDTDSQAFGAIEEGNAGLQPRWWTR